MSQLNPIKMLTFLFLARHRRPSGMMVGILFIPLIFALGCEPATNDEVDFGELDPFGATAKDMPIQEIVAQTFVLSNFEAMLVASRVAGEMKSPPYTAFPPWDSAFEALPYWKKISRNRAWYGHLRDLALGHLHQGHLPKTQLADNMNVVMLNGDVAHISIVNKKPRVDGYPVIADTAASDGYLYMLDRVREPKWTKRTILDIISSDERFSILAQILNHPSLSAKREELRSTTAGLTFFAPTNEALQGFDINECEEPECSAMLKLLVGNHLVGAVVPRMFTATQKLATQSGASLSWSFDTQSVTCTNGDGSLEKVGIAGAGEELALNGIVQPITTLLCTIIEPGGKDQCPEDPDKTEPGDCGCGTPDLDSDGDGVPDCNEEDQTCGRLDDSVDLSKEKYAKQLCCLCENCEMVLADRYYWYLDSHQRSCVDIDMDALSVKPGSETCSETKRAYRETCCKTECTPPAIEQEWEPVAPLPFPQGKYPHCDLCKPFDAPNGQYPLEPYTITAIAYVPGNPSCADLYWMGRTGNLPAAMCYPIQNFMLGPCGCAPPSSVERPRGDEPWCDICPGGQYPLRLGAFLNDLPGNPMCLDLYWMGRTGNISSDLCEQVHEKAQDACGCVAAK